MSDEIITDVKDVWVVETNTDLTEGRGYQYPIHVCESPATAARMAYKKGVMGSDASVHKATAVKVRGSWLAPVEIVKANDKDRQLDERNAMCQRALEKAKAAGLSDDDIKLLGGL